jgi:hypothetical protein
MKCLVLGQYSVEDAKTLVERNAVIQAERETYPGKYSKDLSRFYLYFDELPRLTEKVGFLLLADVENPEQYQNMMTFWSAQLPDVKSFKLPYVPLVEVSESYQAEFDRQTKQLWERKEQSRARVALRRS